MENLAQLPEDIAVSFDHAHSQIVWIDTHSKPWKNGIQLKLGFILLNPFPSLSLAFDLTRSIDGYIRSVFFETPIP